MLKGYNLHTRLLLNKVGQHTQIGPIVAQPQWPCVQLSRVSVLPRTFRQVNISRRLALI